MKQRCCFIKWRGCLQGHGKVYGPRWPDLGSYTGSFPACAKNNLFIPWASVRWCSHLADLLLFSKPAHMTVICCKLIFFFFFFLQLFKVVTGSIHLSTAAWCTVFTQLVNKWWRNKIYEHPPAVDICWFHTTASVGSATGNTQSQVRSCYTVLQCARSKLDITIEMPLSIQQ